jgi:hypothetical protein
MIRYLKVEMIGNPGNSLFCTLTHIKVFGKSMHSVLRDTLREDPSVATNGTSNVT